MKKSTTLLLLLLATFSLFSQEIDRKKGEILIQLLPGVRPESMPVMYYNGTSSVVVPLVLKRPIVADWNIHLYTFDEDHTNADAVLGAARRLPSVSIAQYNHRSQERLTTPNDPNWFQQWDMKIMSLPTAWDAGTGGVTKQGDTIVVAILEKGFQTTHPDLMPNLWHNYAEIPRNEIDDDNNGYTDDYRGWDASSDKDAGTTPATSHGTGVNGIIGAVGDNNTGMAGVNWNVKLLNLAHDSYETTIIPCYAYGVKMRRLYNQSNGEKGAFIVATNTSFGIDNASPADHPLWCAVFDSLGKVGVLSIGATADRNTDVDADGDIPTACTSDYLISVTNTNKNDEKDALAAYGLKSIDLGAPGVSSPTTTINDGYATLGGTSAAAPHVTGLVALLYNLACESFTADARTAPAACARRIRDVILQSTAPLATLEGITVTGGRIDAAMALDSMRALCGGTQGPMSIDKIAYDPTNSTHFIEVDYQTPDFDAYTFRVFDMLGQLMFESKVQPLQYSAKRFQFEAFNYPTGIYVLSLSKGRNVVSKKFLKI